MILQTVRKINFFFAYRLFKNTIERLGSGFYKWSVSETEMNIATRARKKTRQFPCNDNQFSNSEIWKGEDYYFPLLHAKSDEVTFPVESKGNRRVHASYCKRENGKTARSEIIRPSSSE